MTNSEVMAGQTDDSSYCDPLIQGCRHCLTQCEQILETISAKSYVASSNGNASVGAHMRHVLERFQSFFNGIPAGLIDYDARKRDKSLEESLKAASFACATARRRLSDISEQSDLKSMLEVRESVHHQAEAVTIDSTLNRELMGLVSHSIHHLALIGMLMKELGYEVESNFGKAPSTIVYERS